MIKPGIKIGPDGWRQRLEESGAKYCEVWFNLNHQGSYATMFKYLKNQGINTGLHFWGVLPGDIEPNLAYPGPTLKPSLEMVKQTIDIAASSGFTYVNIHIGNKVLIKVDLKAQTWMPDSHTPPISLSDAETTLSQSLLQLNRYAKKNHVLLLVEPIPARSAAGSWRDPKARLSTKPQYSVPVASLIKLAQRHEFYVTNDFCHIFGDEYDQPIATLWQALWNKSQALAPYTKLLHINTVVPPYNGSDSHGGITKKDFAISGTFPSQQKLLHLLSLFKNRTDVWAINEPATDHVANYQSLLKLVSEL